LLFFQKLILHFRRWRLEELSDLWRIVLWLDAQHRQSPRLGQKAMDEYLLKLGPIVKANVERFAVLMNELDDVTGGIYSILDPARNSRIGLPAGTTLMQGFKSAHADLTTFLQKLCALDPVGQTQEWRKILESSEEYVLFVTKLVQQMGNFELTAMSLPGIGEVTVQTRTQAILSEMYRINTRHIRLMDIGYSMLRAWQAPTPGSPANPGITRQGLAFFEPHADVAKLVREMIFEYMIEADPEKIAQAKERAKKAGRRAAKYRFMRPAETFRQMAQVEYETVAGKRKPKPTREYVALDLPAVGSLPTIAVDIQRFEWAMKEVFNNCIAATTQMSVSKHTIEASPLVKLANSNKPAIKISVSLEKKKAGLFTKEFIKLVFHDEGVGMIPAQGAFAPFWAYSTRRGGTEEKQARGELDQADQQELLIGGKGIGLPFARATVMEMGGTLTFETLHNIGTTVTIELPVQSPLTV
jgi:hypothetical protein